jgi:hypothetical protein
LRYWQERCTSSTDYKYNWCWIFGNGTFLAGQQEVCYNFKLHRHCISGCIKVISVS